MNELLWLFLMLVYQHFDVQLFQSFYSKLQLTLVTAVTVNESCIFTEQCEDAIPETECRDGRCICRFDKTPVTKKDGSIECLGEGKAFTLVGGEVANSKNQFFFYSHQGKWFNALDKSWSHYVFDSDSHGTDVHYHLCCSAIVQQVSLRN